MGLPLSLLVNSVSLKDVYIYHINRQYRGGFYFLVYSSSDCVLHNLPCMAAKHTGLELVKRGVCVSNIVYHLKVFLVRRDKMGGETNGLQLDLTFLLCVQFLFLTVTVAPPI